MSELIRKFRILWLTVRIRYHRLAMDGETRVTRRWRSHAIRFTVLCQLRGQLLTPAERYRIERREGLA